MRTRLMHVYHVATLTLLACSSEQRESANPDRSERAATDSAAPYTTREMSEGLTRDVERSNRDLAALEDTIYRSIGDTAAAMIREADARWVQYRKIECDAIRLAFSGGTVAPVAQLECWVALTDARRRFLGEQYDFVRPVPAAPAAGPR